MMRSDNKQRLDTKHVHTKNDVTDAACLVEVEIIFDWRKKKNHQSKYDLICYMAIKCCLPCNQFTINTDCFYILNKKNQRLFG